MTNANKKRASDLKFLFMYTLSHKFRIELLPLLIRPPVKSSLPIGYNLDQVPKCEQSGKAKETITSLIFIEIETSLRMETWISWVANASMIKSAS